MDQVVHCARVLRYRSKSNDWKQCWMLILIDGRIRVYNDKHCNRLLSIRFNLNSTTSNYLQLGTYATEHFDASMFHSSIDSNLLFAVGDTIKKSSKHQWHLFSARSDDDMIGWMRAFAIVLGRKQIFYDKSSSRTRFPTIIDDMSRSDQYSIDEEIVSQNSTNNSHQLTGGMSISDYVRQLHRNNVKNYGHIWQEIITATVVQYGANNDREFVDETVEIDPTAHESITNHN